MPQSLLELIFKTSKQGQGGKQAAAELKELKGGVGELSSGLLGVNLASVGVIGVITGIAAGAKAAVGDTLAYSDQVRDLGRISGATAEETSRLIQTADDLKISYETLTAMTKKFRENGLVLTTEELAKASDKYLALQTQQEKNTFAEQTLGKAWQEGTKILEAGGDALRKMAAGQANNLILTERQVEASRQFERNTDQLNDAWQGIVYTVGNAVIPVLNDLFTAVTKESDVQARIKDQLKELDTRRQDQAIFAEKYTGALRKEAEAQIAAEQAAQAFADKSAAMDAFYGGAVAGANDLATANDGVTTSMNDASIVMQEYTTKLLFNQAAAGLDKDAALLLAASMGLIDEKTLGAMGKLDELKKQLAEGKITLYEYTQQAGILSQTLDGIKSKEIVLTVTTKYNGTQYVDPGTGSGFGGTTHHAAGGSGSFVIPPGWNNDSYPIGGGHYGQSGERVDFTVTPKGRSRSGSGALVGTVIINNGMDLESFRRMLMEATR